MLSFKALGVSIIVLIAAEGASQDQATPKATPKTAPKSKTVAFKLYAVEENVVQQTNAERARHGLPPLVIDQRLVQSARAHTAWMSRARRLQHTSAPVAENIAMGQQNAQEAMRSWMSSSGHRANILNRSYRRIGVSAYSAPDGTVFWTQQFEP